MRSRASIWMVLVAAAGASAVQCTPPPANTAVSRFPHRTHLVRTKVDCYTCHGEIQQSEAVEGFVSPGYEPCKKCHGDSVGPQTHIAFNVAHTFSGTPGPRHVIFSHKNHRDRTNGQCARCHVDVQKDATTARILPSMATCLTCHQDDYAEANCTLCHRGGDLSKLRPETDIPHGADYVPRHHTDAIRARNLCMACHEESHCSSCHDTNAGLRAEVRRLDDVHGTYKHQGDFVTHHAIEARSNATSCVRCHEPSSCDTCHANNGVSGNVVGGATPHPSGWVGGDPGGPNFHGRVARRRIVECAACHEQGPATNCIRCHKVGAYGGNPHPSGWESSQGRGTTETCQYCHTQ